MNGEAYGRITGFVITCLLRQTDLGVRIPLYSLRVALTSNGWRHVPITTFFVESITLSLYSSSSTLTKYTLIKCNTSHAVWGFIVGSPPFQTNLVINTLFNFTLTGSFKRWSMTLRTMKVE